MSRVGSLVIIFRLVAGGKHGKHDPYLSGALSACSELVPWCSYADCGGSDMRTMCLLMFRSVFDMFLDSTVPTSRLSVLCLSAVVWTDVFMIVRCAVGFSGGQGRWSSSNGNTGDRRGSQGRAEK